MQQKLQKCTKIQSSTTETQPKATKITKINLKITNFIAGNQILPNFTENQPNTTADHGNQLQLPICTGKRRKMTKINPHITKFIKYSQTLLKCIKMQPKMRKCIEMEPKATDIDLITLQYYNKTITDECTEII